VQLCVSALDSLFVVTVERGPALHMLIIYNEVGECAGFVAYSLVIAQVM